MQKVGKSVSFVRMKGAQKFKPNFSRVAVASQAKPYNKPLPRKSLGKPGPPSSATGTDQCSKQRVQS
eukprot:851516-Pelagomonas_calceolata.AAC.1